MDSKKYQRFKQGFHLKSTNALHFKRCSSTCVDAACLNKYSFSSSNSHILNSHTLNSLGALLPPNWAFILRCFLRSKISCKAQHPYAVKCEMWTSSISLISSKLIQPIFLSSVATNCLTLHIMDYNATAQPAPSTHCSDSEATALCHQQLAWPVHAQELHRTYT